MPTSGLAPIPIASIGDTHLHTSNSVDAFAFGAKLGPEDALRFARGEEATATRGLKVKLDRPLDCLVFADHSGGLGATQVLYDAPRLFVRDPTLRRWHDTMHERPAGRVTVTTELIDLAGRLAAFGNGSRSRNDRYGPTADWLLSVGGGRLAAVP